MLNLFDQANPFRAAYSNAYATLSELRENFHRSGRLDDSNAKLDEVSKLFATYLAFKAGHITYFPSAESGALVPSLQAAFLETAKLPQYNLGDGTSVFGNNPTLAIRQEDESLVANMVKLVRQGIDFTLDNRSQGLSFDILNEAFGHFVRDNFRSNIEDAQYMTPPEVATFMAEMVLQDLKSEGQYSPSDRENLTILDPACGVGSFLGAVYQFARNSSWLDPHHLRLLGQDKIERMVRLATLNLEMFDVREYRITIGNSLESDSPLDELNGTVDVIITNPPFGARFSPEYIARSCGDNTPFFSRLKRPEASIFSEQLFIDRNLRLLKEGGRLLIIVPDGVVSSRGTSALLRQHLSNVCKLYAVIELPATTFAQAGTRTKTAILYLQKGSDDKKSKVFMSVCKDLGFQVSSRKGVQIKTMRGENELTDIATSYGARLDDPLSQNVHVLSTRPSCVMVPESTIFSSSWTPSHYSAERIQAMAAIGQHAEFEMVPLGELVEFCAGIRKAESWRDGCAFISVLHILGEGFINVRGAFGYAPKTPGLPTQPGELLIACINPRISRVCVTPDLGTDILCSSEFEILRAKDNVDIYTVAYMLQTHNVQKQIRNLTSGTSASHNRIRKSDLSQVLIPIAKPGTKSAESVSRLTDDYRVTLESLIGAGTVLADLRNREKELFT